MIYLYVLSGRQAGSSMLLESGRTYFAADNFDADIYVENNDNQGPLAFTFSITNEQVVFEQADGLKHKNTELDLDQYALPFICSAGGADIIFIRDADYNTAFEYYCANNMLPESLPDLDPTNELINKFDDLVINEKNEEINANLEYSGLLSRIIQQLQQNNFLKRIINWNKGLFSRFPLKTYGRLAKVAYITMAVFAVLSIVGLLIIYQSHRQDVLLDKSAQTVSLSKSINAKLELLQAKYPSLDYTQDGNKYTISGIVAKHEDIAKVSLMLADIKSNLVIRIWAFNDIREQLIALMKQNNILLADAIFNQSNAVLELHGLTDNMENLDNAQIAIDAKFGGINDIDANKVFLTASIEKDLQNILVQNNYREKLTVNKNYAQGYLSLGGYLSNDELTQLKSVTESFNRKYGNVVKLQLDIQDAVLALPFKIDEVYTGTDPWLLTSDGQRIYEGGSYLGITLISIDDNKIILKKNFLISINLSQLISLDNNHYKLEAENDKVYDDNTTSVGRQL